MGKKNAALPEVGKESSSGFADLKYNKKPYSVCWPLFWSC